MKYVIMCGGYYEHWKTPKQLQVINGERIVERTIRILKELGVRDICITSNNPQFDDLGVPRLEHENSYRYEDIKDKNNERTGTLKGYWLDAFYPNFENNIKVTYLYGDVYYTEECLRTVVGYIEDKKNILFSTGYEPLAYRVNDYTTFMDGIKSVKKLQDAGKITRDSGVAITWELYRYLNGIDINKHGFVPETHIKITDGSEDVDWNLKLKIMNKRFKDIDRKLGNVFTVFSINSIGGGESFLYYLAKKYKDRDITILFRKGDMDQVERLRKYARMIRYTGQKIKCKRVFFNFNRAFIDNIEADEYYQIIHADYYENDLKPTYDERIKYIAVSQLTKNAFEKQTGFNCNTISYNPIIVDDSKLLVLMSATRLNQENKGKARIERLANLLQENGVKFIWFIFTNDEEVIDNKNIVYVKQRLDSVDFIPRVDWFVQLSSNEAYCYSVVESLIKGVPCIVTPCPVFEEIGLVDKKNCLFLDFDFNELSEEFIDNLYKIKPNSFEYTAIQDGWDNLLVSDKSTYIYDPNESIVPEYVYFKPKSNYFDVELGRNVEKTEQPFIIERERANELVSKSLGIIVVYKDKDKQDKLLNYRPN